MADSAHLLSDAQMQEFIVNGFTVLKPDLPASLHEEIYRQTEEVISNEGNPGNNILPRVPVIHKVFDHPVIQGALTSVLGPEYIMHSHRHCHVNPAGSPGGGTHKDSYWGYSKVRYHRNRWAMIFYYPQDVTEENGPTAVVPGTHYYESRESWEGTIEPVPLCGEAGTAALVHFDLWHQATPNQTDKMRYMMKFQFARMTEPTSPTWNAQKAAWPDEIPGAQRSHRGLWSQMWRWHRGQTNGNGAGATRAADTEDVGGVADAVAQLQSGDEDERTRAADALSACGPSAGSAVDALVTALHDEYEPVRLNAGYALGTVGAPAIDVLADSLDDESEQARLQAAYGMSCVGAQATERLAAAVTGSAEAERGLAAYALGEMGNAATDEVTLALASLVDDDSEWVRRNVAEALGTVPAHPQTIPGLVSLLADEDGQARFNAAYSLAKHGSAAVSAIPALETALEDENRYVRNNSAEALKQIDTREAQDALMRFLDTSRWCPITTKDSTF